MPRRSLLTGFCLCVLAAASAHAAGVNLRWNDCAFDGGVADHDFACNANVPSHLLVASFVLPSPQVDIDGIEVDLDVSVAGGALPAWWDLRTAGGCRPTSLTANPVAHPADVVCVPVWGEGAAAGGVASYTIGTFGASSARIQTVMAVAPLARVTLVADRNYFVENLLVDSQSTVGIGSCSGCSAPACVAIERIALYAGPTLLSVLTKPANGVDSNFATWQGGVGVPPLPGGACPAVVPTHTSTWSAVKSLYR
jgi:hypothetical protein